MQNASPDGGFYAKLNNVTVRVLISPPASGKTRHCLDCILEHPEGRPLGRVWVIVPDRLQAVAFRSRLAARGGMLGVRVETFAGLYREILERAGRLIPLASEALLQRLTRRSIDAVASAGRMQHYHPIRDKTGFVLSLRQRFAELKRARVFPEAFLTRAQHNGVPAQIEIARIYQAYQEHLLDLNWADEEGLGWLAVLALNDMPDLMADTPLLIVDGFDSFVATQLDALQQMSHRLPEILITLPGTPAMNRPAHRRFGRALQALTGSLPFDEVLGPNPTWLPDPLARFTGRLFDHQARPLENAGAITLLEARGPAEEAREVLRWLKARGLRDGLAPSDCAVVIPNLDLYRTHLRLAAGEFGLPLRFSHGVPLARAPAIDTLIALLRLPVVQFSPQRTLALLRSPYIDLRGLGFEARDADALENVSRYGQVISGLNQWEDALQALAERSEPSEPEAFGEDLSLPWLPSPEEAARLKRALRSLVGWLEIGTPRSLREWLDWLGQLMKETHFALDAPNPNDLAAVTVLAAVLSDLDRAEDLAALPDLDYGAFLDQLAGALEAAWYDLDAEDGEACIQVLTVIEARGLRYRAVAILGLAEGLFPEVERVDPFLSEELRRDLGLELRLGREQAGLFYQAVTRTDRSLLLTRPYMGEQGEPWEPSPFWHAAARLLPQEPIRVRPTGWRPLSEAGSIQEALFWAARRRADRDGHVPAIPAMPGALDRWRGVLRASDVLAARLSASSEGPFEGSLGDLAAELEEAFNHWRRWSPSGLETYAGCPHRFFAERVLGLVERRTPEPGFDAAQLGSMLHAILEGTFREAADPTDEASLLEALEDVASRDFETAPERLGFRANVTWDVERAGLIELLKKNISALAADGRGWTPIALELPFGFADAPPLELDLKGVAVQVRGLIDRLDRDAAGRLRVIDYKTGSRHLGAADLLDGRRLQLPLYALAAEQALGLGTAAEGYYWHLRGARPGSLKLSRFAGPAGEGPQGAAATAREHVARILQGVRAGQFPPQPPAGGCPSYCAAARWCWRFQPGF